MELSIKKAVEVNSVFRYNVDIVKTEGRRKMYCPNCGANAGNSKFCSECGFRLPVQDAAATTDTGTLTLRKYNAAHMKDVVADVYIDGILKTTIGNNGSVTLTVPAGMREVLIHVDGCVDAIQKVPVEALENRLCIFSVDDAGFINIVQQGDPSRSSAYSSYVYTGRSNPAAGTAGAAAAAYMEQETADSVIRETPLTRGDFDAVGDIWEESEAEITTAPENMKYCRFCGSLIYEESVVCPNCGRQVEKLQTEEPKAYVHNADNYQTRTTVTLGGREKNKWVAFLLCFFLGVFGIHKFYEGKVGMGLLYLFTMGLFGIGVLVDLILLVMKPNPYYV